MGTTRAGYIALKDLGPRCVECAAGRHAACEPSTTLCGCRDPEHYTEATYQALVREQGGVGMPEPASPIAAIANALRNPAVVRDHRANMHAIHEVGVERHAVRQMRRDAALDYLGIGFGLLCWIVLFTPVAIALTYHWVRFILHLFRVIR